ncbi:ATP-binding protein [Streptomyces sp. NPDC049954]|uniref:ATP-binding protein n=1 Tax=Streptomyces sp. NPDC049954 TaxID=3155779 RepID=UPI00342BCCBA
MEPNSPDDGTEGTGGTEREAGHAEPVAPPEHTESPERPGPPEAVLALRPAEARERVHDLLLPLTPPVDVLVLADAVLVASELVTNALRHGGGVTGFRVALVDGMIEVTASDRSGQPPVRQDAGDAQGAADRGDLAGGGGLPGGYGWPLVCRIAWTEVTRTATGKTIRAWIPLHPMPQQGPSGLIPAQRCAPPP